MIAIALFCSRRAANFLAVISIGDVQLLCITLAS
jgi:hypothetical protein